MSISHGVVILASEPDAMLNGLMFSIMIFDRKFEKFTYSDLTFTKNPIIFNIASGSEANITTSCEMEIFNFLWLIWDHYIPLAPT